jgi:hypothetical protein
MGTQKARIAASLWHTPDPLMQPSIAGSSANASRCGLCKARVCVVPGYAQSSAIDVVMITVDTATDIATQLAV